MVPDQLAFEDPHCIQNRVCIGVMEVRMDLTYIKGDK